MINSEKRILRAEILALVLIIGFLLVSVMPAAADLTVEPITWNTIGLDSSDVSVGPNQFPVGVRVHNTGGASASNVVATFVWDSVNSYINLYPSTTTTSTIGTIVAGGYKDAYFTVSVARNAAAYDTARRYHINITASSLPAVSTPTPRELYVERLISESRSSEVEVTLGGTVITPGGTMNLVVGSSYQIILRSNTAAQGCNQLEAFINMPSTIFQILSVNTSYTVPAPGSINRLYADACGWENDPNDPDYRSCSGGDDNSGGTVTTTYQVKVLKLPTDPLTNPLPVSSLIYDFSGAGYHYNSDFEVSARYISVSDPNQIQISKTFVPEIIAPGGTSTLTFVLTNPTSGTISGINFTDAFPAGSGIVVASPTAATFYGFQSPPVFAPVAGAGSVSFSNGTLAAHCTGTVKVNVTRPAGLGTGGPFTNTTGLLYINGTTHTGLTASDTLTVSNTAVPCGSRMDMAHWTVPNHSTNPPDIGAGNPTSYDSSHIPSVPRTYAGVPSESEIDDDHASNGDSHSWSIWATGSVGNYIEFSIDTRNFSQVYMSFNEKRLNTDSAKKLTIYYNNGAGFQQNGDVIALPNDKDHWYIHNTSNYPNQLDFTGKTNPAGSTQFRIIPTEPSGSSPNDQKINFDDITFTGISCYPPPTLTKYFDTDPIIVTTDPLNPNVSLLTFIVGNNQTTPNDSQDLTGISFTDTLPAGLLICNDAGHPATNLCGGTLTAVDGTSTISLSGVDLTANTTCTVSVHVYGTAAGVYNNVSGPITSNETPGNLGYATDSIVVRNPEAGIQLLKQVSSAPTGPWVSYLAVEAGDPVYYQLTVENTGDTELSGVTVEDPAGTVVCNWASLPAPVPGNNNHIVTCTTGPVAATVGAHVNTAAASGTYNGTTYTDTDSATYATAGLTIVKVAEEDSFSTAGDVLHYTYTVANTGYAPLEGPVTIIDDIATGESCQDLTAIGDQDNYLDVGESVTCTATYIVTDADISNGSVTNTVYATAAGFQSDTKIVTVNSILLAADVEVVKSCEPVVPGYSLQQLVYVITVTNNGPSQAINVALADAVPGTLTSVEYTIDGGSPLSPWPNPLDLSNMDPGTSHVIRIYAVVPSGFTSSNTASVASTTTDPVLTNNSSTCTTTAIPAKRQALEFLQTDPSDYYVTVNDSATLDTMTSKGTIEAWVCPKTAFTADAGIVFKGEPDAPDGICYGFGLGGGGSVFTEGTSENIGFVIENSAGTRYLLTATHSTLKLNRWYHIACVWDKDAAIKMTIYINGLVEAARITAIDDARTNDDDLMFAIQNITPAKFLGAIDEIRVWDTARTRTQIRDTMCKKLTGTESGLIGYWRFDEESGDTCLDTSGKGNSGILPNADRICSEAPLGDASLWDYSGAVPGDFTINLASPYGDNITVSGDGGIWDLALRSGLQVYRVDDAPTPSSAPLGWRFFTSAPHYWGVFITGGTAPTYRMVYNYKGYPGIINEDALQMAYRKYNCEIWKGLDATLDTVADTLTKGELAGTEFILGSYMDPRNAIEFDGGDYVNVTDTSVTNSLDLTTAGTLEAWIYISVLTPNAGIIDKRNATSGYSLTTDATGDRIVLILYNSGSDFVTNATPLNLDTWYHIAATWDGVSMKLYINGVLDSLPYPSAQTSGSTIGNDMTVGVGNNVYFKGRIDEVRVWNVARTQTDIRNTMCKKVTSADAGFSNLMGYWRFDEETDSPSTPDYTGNGNDGTMINFADVRAARICSSAPIGDGSAYDYYDSGVAGTVSAQLAHSDGDYMFGTQNTGTWNTKFSGLQIYRLDEAPVYPPDLWHLPDYPEPPYGYITPNGLTPPAGWSSIDYYRYWGVFVTDWDDANAPTYDAFYYYSGNPSVPANADGLPAPHPQIGLAKRPDYCFGTWEAPPSPPANWDFTNSRLQLFSEYQFGTPTLSLPTNPEYVLGGIDQPLAITLASFTATASGGCVDVAWETATEINTAGFYIWRSDNPLTDFVLINNSLIPSNSVIGSMGAKYAIQDCGLDFTGGKTYYYKLEEIEFGSTGDGNMHGPIGPVSETVAASQTSTAASKDSNCFIDSVWQPGFHS